MCSNPITYFYTTEQKTISINNIQHELPENLIKDIESRYQYVLSGTNIKIEANNVISIKALFYKYGITLKEKETKNYE